MAQRKVKGLADQRQPLDQIETARELAGVMTALHSATYEMAKLAVAHADAFERRGHEIDGMLAKIRSTMASTAS